VRHVDSSINNFTVCSLSSHQHTYIGQDKVLSVVLSFLIHNKQLMFPVSCHTEQLNLCSQHRIVNTVEDSVLRTEMTGLESQEEDTPKSILYFR
jgi:hypothetical protein